MSEVLTRVRAHLGTTALAISIIEPLTIWGAFALRSAGHDVNSAIKVFMCAYLAGIASIPLAVTGLLLGPKRAVACVALALGAVNFVICGIPLLQ